MIKRSKRLQGVSYDLCGPLYEKAKALEQMGHRITKLNIGNPAPFGFEAPQEVVQHIIRNLGNAQGYSDHKGMLSAREAVRACLNFNFLFFRLFATWGTSPEAGSATGRPPAACKELRSL